MEPASHEAVTIRSHPTYEDVLEAEAGLGRLIGRGVDRPSGLSALGLKSTLGVFGRLSTTVTTLSDQGILIKGSRYGLIPWAEIGDSYGTDGLVCLVIARTTVPIALPKRAMTQDQLGLVRQYLAAHVTSDEPGHVATNWGFRESGDFGINAVHEYLRQRAALVAPRPPAGLNANGQALPGHVCGRCAKPLSPAWVGKCKHCSASYGEFPPVAR